MKHILPLAAIAATLCAQAAGPDISTLEGSRNWNFYSGLPSTSGWQSKKSFIEIADAAAGRLTVHFAGAYPVAATYDQEAATITFQANQKVGHNANDDYDVFFFHDRWNAERTQRSQTDEPIVAWVSSNTIGFNPDDIVAIGNRTKGYFYYGYENEMKRVVPEDISMPEEGWEFSHTADLCDGWHTMTIGPEDCSQDPYEVEVQKNADIPGLYRIVNPYAEGTPMYDDNLDKEAQGYIVFSIEDPEYVTVWPCIYSGYTDPYVGKCYNYNTEGLHTVLMDYTKEEVLQLGVLTDKPSYYDEEYGIIFFNNVFFGLSGDLAGDYQWTESYMTSTLTMPRGNAAPLLPADPETDGLRGQTRFLDLQGRPLAAPQPGQPCIRIRNGKAEKIL